MMRGFGMQNLKTYIVVNEKLEHLISFLKEYFTYINGIEPTIIASKQKLRELHHLVEPYEQCNVIVVGGDGTLHHTINELQKVPNHQAIIHIIGLGTGNDYERSLADYDQVFQSDLIKMEADQRTIYGINSWCIGLDADIANDLDQFRDCHNPYQASIIYHFLHYRPYLVQYQLSKEETNYITMLALMNGNYYGNGRNISPDSILNDGYLDFYTVDKINKLRIMKLFLLLEKGKHVNHVRHEKVKEIVITSPTSLLNANVDGELYSFKKAKISVEKASISVCPNDVFELKKVLERSYGKKRSKY